MLCGQDLDRSRKDIRSGRQGLAALAEIAGWYGRARAATTKPVRPLLRGDEMMNTGLDFLFAFLGSSTDAAGLMERRT